MIIIIIVNINLYSQAILATVCESRQATNLVYGLEHNSSSVQMMGMGDL